MDDGFDSDNSSRHNSDGVMDGDQMGKSVHPSGYVGGVVSLCMDRGKRFCCVDVQGETSGG